MINLDEILSGKKSVAIGGHIRPDGDCVGSVLSMLNFIYEYYPDIKAQAYLEPIPNIFKFLKHSEDIILPDYDAAEEPYDLFICLDCSDTRRLGAGEERFHAAKETLCIDHHHPEEKIADNEYIIPDYSSTCELVFDLLGEERIDKAVAECLYTGMIHDTGVFKFGCTTKKTMDCAGILMDKGIDFTRIVDKTFFQKTYDQNRVMGRALQKSVRLLDNRVVASYITLDEMKEFNVLPKHLDGIVGALRDTKDALIAIFLYELSPGVFKASTRATAEVNLADLAKRHGGGGHAKAAGFEMKGDPVESLGIIATELEPILNSLPGNNEE